MFKILIKCYKFLKLCFSSSVACLLCFSHSPSRPLVSSIRSCTLARSQCAVIEEELPPPVLPPPPLEPLPPPPFLPPPFLPPFLAAFFSFSSSTLVTMTWTAKVALVPSGKRTSISVPLALTCGPVKWKLVILVPRVENWSCKNGGLWVGEGIHGRSTGQQVERWPI